METLEYKLLSEFYHGSQRIERTAALYKGIEIMKEIYGKHTSYYVQLTLPIDTEIPNGKISTDGVYCAGDLGVPEFETEKLAIEFIEKYKQLLKNI
jgi:hypothetical protein